MSSLTLARTRLATIAAVLGLAVVGLTAQSAADLFDGNVLQRVDLNLNSQDWLKLKQGFKTNDYYPADMTWN